MASASLFAMLGFLTLSKITQENYLDNTSTRILFVGNSFTFVNDLPHQIKHVAESLGDKVVVENSTIGGCTLYAQTPEMDQRTKKLLKEDWDFIVLQVFNFLHFDSPIPDQRTTCLLQTQDYSALPTVKQARHDYLYPAVQASVYLSACNV